MSKLSNEELAIRVELLVGYINREIYIEGEPINPNGVIREATKRLRNTWIPIDEFLKEPVLGLCWVVTIEEQRSYYVKESYYTYKGDFLSFGFPEDYLDIKQITHILPIKKPELLR